jgi:quinolinate synthase
VFVQYLDPDPDAVQALGESLLEANMGIVAHYYMDVELQGVLTAVKRSNVALSNRIGIADSLKMGDLAVSMCKEDGVTAVACLGVDFMSESVSAIMNRNGFGHVPVYRATSAAIGCSLAESAERDSYRAWLEAAQRGAQAALHVVYINTSLETKAVSSSIAPTITCTSSNVLQTMLQASAQVPDLKILYGPDTYMGDNLVALLDAILKQTTAESSSSSSSSSWDDARIARDLHPLHNRKTLARLRDNIDVYPSGNCVVHHMFGSEVVDTVKRNYDDAFVTAHLEVPGEMFQVAMERSLEGRGVVGSTSDILKFITQKVDDAARELSTASSSTRLKFILGTEAGMVTSIVKSVQDILDATGSNVEAEIVFPVASDAVMGVEDGGDLALVPGVSGGEGCSTAGGCATCPFMKMNNLDALQDIVDMVRSGSPKDEMRLTFHLPPSRLQGKRIGGVDAMDLGTMPILYMREFMKNGVLPEELLKKVRQVS